MLIRVENGLLFRYESEVVKIEPWGKDGIRIRATMGGKIPEHEWALFPQEKTEAEVTIDGHVGTVKNGKLTCKIDRSMLSFFNSDGKLLFAEQWRGGNGRPSPCWSPLNIPSREYDHIAGGFFRVKYHLDAYDDEKIYGMGQYQDGIFNKKGATLELAQRNTQASVPFFISSRGYGFLWNNPAVGTATFGANRTDWTADSTDCIDYWVTADDTPADILKNYLNVTGKPPMMPEYGLGFWQCKLRYRTQEQVLEIAREYKRRGIPLDVIVIDFFHWTKQGDWKFNSRYFPDPDAMVAELKSMGVETMVSVWPTVEPASENFREMEENGFLIHTKRGVNIQMTCLADNRFFDSTNPEARKYVWEKVKNNYFEKGIKLYWLDVAEPEYTNADFNNYFYSVGPAESTANIYPQTYARTFYEGLKESGVESPLSLERCAWAGSQKYGALVWSGDIGVNFTVFNIQVRAGLSMAAAGIPWWTTDIGGFTGGDQNDPEYRELITRWFEWATYCPVMRLHGDRKNGPTDIPAGECGSGGPNEVWSYGEEVYEIMKAHIEKRNTLRPYIRATMKAAHEDGETVMAPLFLRFPKDEVVWDISDEFMFGADLLVAPVLEAGARERKVYLPRGEKWKNAVSGEVFEGGQTIVAPAPIEYIPTFTRVGGSL